MPYIEYLIEHPQTYRLGLSLLHFLWQGAAVAMVAALITTALRRRSPALRYVVLLVALGLMALLPVATFCLIDPPAAPEHTAALMGGEESFGEETRLEFPLEAVDGARSPVIDPAGDAAAAQGEATLWSAWIDWMDHIHPFLPWVVLGWGMGVLSLSVRLAADWLSVARLVRRQVQPVTDSIRQTADRLCEAFRIRHAVTLLESAVVNVPTVVGFWRPVILLPVSALVGLSPQQFESLLAHELAHIRRYDYLANMLQSVVETLLFYHPAVWWLSHRIRAEREDCCDDIAVSAVGNRLLYAQALVDMAKLRNRQRALAVAAGGSDLRSRIQRVMGLSTDGPSRPVIWWIGALLLTTPLIGMSTLSADPARRTPPVDASRASDLARQKLRQERQKLRGTWEVISCQSEKGDFMEPPCSWLAVRDSKMTIAIKGKSVTTEYALDIGKEPKELALTGIGGKEVTAVYSVRQDSAVVGLDSAVARMAFRTSPRAPTKLEAPQAEGRLLMTLRRTSAVEAAALERNARPRWEHFGRLDQDKDGRLTVEELLADYPTPDAAKQGTRFFELLDGDHDYELTLDEFTANLRKAMFLRMDLNADGALSQKEFAHGEMKAAPRRRARRVFELVDKDHDGSLNFDEFVSRTPEAWLVKLDTSEDGRLTYDEYAAGNQALVRNNRCRRAFAVVDRDGDGSLSLDELANKPRQELFIRRDADANGKLTFEELLFRRRDPVQVTAAKEELAQRDQDGDGVLTLKEYTTPAAESDSPTADKAKDKSTG